jgi:uncharacterized membrane protein
MRQSVKALRSYRSMVDHPRGGDLSTPDDSAMGVVTGGWGGYALALLAFLLTHFVPTRRHARAWLIGRLGRRVYFSLYGLVSLVVLVWVIVAAGRAPFVGLWGPAEWQRWVPLLVMPVALVLAVLGTGGRYPHTLGGRQGNFDPSAPGIASLTRHPLIWALALWALAHLVANGDLAHAILFGSFAALSLAAMPLFDWRARRAVGEREWAAIRQATALLSPAPLASMHWWRANRRQLSRAAIIGLGVFLFLLVVHEPVIGVSPAPR